jgi:small-conductance mechanosensitive channel
VVVERPERATFAENPNAKAIAIVSVFGCDAAAIGRALTEGAGLGTLVGAGLGAAIGAAAGNPGLSRDRLHTLPDAARGAAVSTWSPTVVRVRALIVMAFALASFALSESAAPPAFAQPAAQQTQRKEPVEPTVMPIPIPEIAERAEQLVPVLRSAEQIAVGADVQDIEDQLPAAGEWISGRLEGTTQALAWSPSANALANLTDSWRVMRSKLAAWNDSLTKRATQLEQGLEQLKTMRRTWSASREKALASRTPALVVERIDGTLAAIAAARQGVGERLTHVLGLQDRVVKEIARCDAILSKIAQAGTALVGPLFARDGLPIWSPEARTLISTDLGQRLRESVGDIVELTGQFLAGQLSRVPFQIALFVVVLVLARLARAGARRRSEKEPSEQAAAQVFELPISAALVLALLATGWIYPQAPRVLINVVGLLVLLPVVLIVRRPASPEVVPAVYALAAFFLVDRARDVCSVVPVLEQWVFLLEMVSGIVFLVLAVRSEQLLTDGGSQAAFGWRHVLAWILWGQLLILVGAVFTGAIGYMRLARPLGGEVLASSYVALVLYAGVRVGEGLVAYLLRGRPLRQLFMLQRHRALVQRRINLALRWLSVGTWAYFTLDGLGVMSPIWSAGAMALNARYMRGSVSLSLGDTAAFGLTVWAAFLLSSFVRFVLREDVYPRVWLARGVPYAVSTLIHYAIILAGFIFAVAALGVDLNRITILAGAFGVGIGIGLQNVVANFVAGLILLLERRIHVGDSVQIGDLQGEVREIGSRASTIRTWNGAEVIVPNASLTSERVTNWTLSDRLRRVDLEIGVAYGADPEQVLEVLPNVAKAHPKALAEPAPLALCTGFGDSTLKFVLRVWTAHFEESESVLSELAVGVHAAITAAKVEILSPPRDIQIRNVESEQPSVLRRQSSGDGRS